MIPNFKQFLCCFCLIFLEDDHQNSSLSSSYRNSMAATPIRIETCRKGCGMTLKSIRVYFGDSNNYRIHHIVQVLVTANVFVSC